jgi:Tfp pilus assembly protein PilF
MAADPLTGPGMQRFAPGAVELGWSYFRKGDLETALRRFQMAVRHDPAYAPGYYGVAYICSVQGRLEAAVEFYRKALERDPTHPYTYANLGYALLLLEREGEALPMLDEALALYPGCGEAHLSYAIYYAEHDQWGRAGASARKAIEFGQTLDPEFLKALKAHDIRLETPGG